MKAAKSDRLGLASHGDDHDTIGPAEVGFQFRRGRGGGDPHTSDRAANLPGETRTSTERVIVGRRVADVSPADGRCRGTAHCSEQSCDQDAESVANAHGGCDGA